MEHPWDLIHSLWIVPVPFPFPQSLHCHKCPFPFNTNTWIVFFFSKIKKRYWKCNFLPHQQEQQPLFWVWNGWNRREGCVCASTTPLLQAEAHIYSEVSLLEWTNMCYLLLAMHHGQSWTQTLGLWWHFQSEKEYSMNTWLQPRGSQYGPSLMAISLRVIAP